MQTIFTDLPPTNCTVAEFQAWRTAQEKPAAGIPDGFYSCRQLAAQIGVTSRQIRKLASSGRIKGAMLDKVHGWLIPYGYALKKGKRGPSSKVSVR